MVIKNYTVLSGIGSAVKKFVVFVKENPFLFALILIAAILQILVIFPSGSSYCFNGHCGDYFWGVHEHDGIWHIAVAETAFRTFPPRNPIFTGSPLSGYNSLLDLILFLFSEVGISSFTMYFKILPVVWFILFTWSAIALGKKISNKKIFLFLFLFLSYFGASFSFIIPLIKTGTISGTSSLLAMQPILTLTNVQLAFSYIILFLILTLLHEKRLTKKQMGMLCLYTFLQWGLKFYAGFISTIIVCVVFLLRWMREKKLNYFIYLLSISLSSAVSLFINYNPFGQLKSGSAPFVFRPLALVWPLIEDPSMFYSYYWSNAKYTLLASSKISPRLILLMGILTLLYIVLTLGPRIIGLMSLIKKSLSRKRTDIDVGVLAGVCLSLIFPIFFVQRGVWWNTVQFFFPIFLLLNIYTAELVLKIKNKTLSMVFICILIVISIPYTVDALKGYVTFPGVVNVSQSEKEALSFLRALPDGVIYTPVYKPNSLLNQTGNIPLFNHVDSSYVSAYTGKQTFYTNYVQLQLLNVPYEERKKQIAQGECDLVKGIDYAYINSSQVNDLFMKKCIFMNKDFEKKYSKEGISVYIKIK